MVWQKGQSGNPGGKVRGPTTSTAIRQLLKSKPTDGNDAYRMMVAQKLLDLALEGDVAAIKVLLDRAEGRVPQETDITLRGDPTAPLTIIFERVASRDNSDPNQAE